MKGGDTGTGQYLTENWDTETGLYHVKGGATGTGLYYVEGRDTGSYVDVTYLHRSKWWEGDSMYPCAINHGREGASPPPRPQRISRLGWMGGGG